MELKNYFSEPKSIKLMIQSQVVKVVLADRYSHFRDNLRSVFRKTQIEVSGEADTAEDLLDRLAGLKPDLLITAHRLHDHTADHFLPLIKEKFPDLKILLITLNCSKKVLLNYIGLLDGMLCKMAHRDELLDAVKDIALKNKVYFRIDRDGEEIIDQRKNKIRG